MRDHGLQIDTEKMKEAAGFLKQSLRRIEESRDMAQLREYEGEDAGIYFGVFRPAHITAEKGFLFQGTEQAVRLWIM